MRRFVCLICLLGLPACSGLYEPRPTVTPVTESSVVSSTSALSTTTILDPARGYVVCSQSQPDATFSQGETGDFSVSLLTVGTSNEVDDGGESEESQEIALVGRSPAVLVARELFFRLCEFSRNHKLSADQATALYKQTLTVVAEGWKAEAANTKVTIGETQSDTSTQAVTGDAPAPTSLETTASDNPS